MLKDRDFLLRSAKIMRYVIAAFALLVILSLLLPYYTYTGVVSSEKQSTISILGFIGFPKNYPQMRILMKNATGVNIKYLTMGYMIFPVSTIIASIVSIVVALRKKGIGTSLFPLWTSIYGLIGYFSNNTFLSLGNHGSSKAIQIAILALLLIAAIVNVVIGVMEIKTRPADYYLPMME